MAAVDLDGDGDLDIVRVNLDGSLAQLLRNDLDARTNPTGGWPFGCRDALRTPMASARP